MEPDKSLNKESEKQQSFPGKVAEKKINFKIYSDKLGNTLNNANVMNVALQERKNNHLDCDSTDNRQNVL